MTRVGQPTSLLCVCVRRGLEKRQCCCLVSGGLPSSHPISSHFTHFLYATGTLPAIALVVNPRVGGFVCILSPCGPFKWTLLRNQQFLLLPQLPLVFTASSCEALFSWCWTPGLCSLAWGWDCSLPRCPSWFLATTRECGNCCSTTAASPPHTASSLPGSRLRPPPTG